MNHNYLIQIDSLDSLDSHHNTTSQKSDSRNPAPTVCESNIALPLQGKPISNNVPQNNNNLYYVQAPIIQPNQGFRGASSSDIDSRTSSLHELAETIHSERSQPQHPQDNMNSESIVDIGNSGGRQNPENTNTTPFQKKRIITMLFNVNSSQINWYPDEVAAEILSKSFEITIYLLICYIFMLLFVADVLSFYTLFSFSAVTCFCQIVRVLKFSGEAPNSTLRQKRVKYFRCLDRFILGVFIIVGGVRIQVSHTPLTPFVLPGFVVSILYHVFCNDSASFLKAKVVVFFKFLFWTQLLLVSLKADSVIESWSQVFGPLLYACILMMAVSVGYFSFSVYRMFKNSDLGYFGENVVGLVWCLLTASYSWIMALFMIAITKKFDNNEDHMLMPVLLVAVTHSILYMMFIVSLKDKLTIYLIVKLEDLIINDDAEIYVESFEKIKENVPYLLKISPTYFMTIQKDFKMKDKQHTKECKNQIKHVKKQAKSNKLQKNKIHTKIEVGSDIPELKSATAELQSTNEKFSLGKNVLAIDNVPKLESTDNNLCYSDDDAEVLDEVQQQSLKKLDDDEKESSCVVCCMNNPNAVFMSCGHGGICYECAIKTWKSGDKCFMCRQSIEVILKVNVLDRVNVAKVIEGTKKNITVSSYANV